MKKTIFLLICLFTSSVNAVSLVPTFIGSADTVAAGSYKLSTGNSAIPNDAPVSDASIEAFLGLSAGSLDGLQPGDAIEGSALKGSVAVSIGDIFSFDWVWSTVEDISTADQFNDFAFHYINFNGAILADALLNNGGKSGSVTWAAPSAGNLFYGVGVMDVSDGDIDSFITVSNIQLVAAPPVGIPEPASLALLGLGLVGIGISRSRKKRRICYIFSV